MSDYIKLLQKVKDNVKQATVGKQGLHPNIEIIVTVGFTHHSSQGQI